MECNLSHDVHKKAAAGDLSADSFVSSMNLLGGGSLHLPVRCWHRAGAQEVFHRRTNKHNLDEKQLQYQA